MVQKQENLIDRQFLTNIVINYIYNGVSPELLTFLSQRNSLYITRIVNYIINDIRNKNSIGIENINELILRCIMENDISTDKLFKYTENEIINWKTEGRFHK